MKNLQLLLITLCLSVSSLFAQTPEKLSYQAIVRNSSDLILANTNIGMQISILQNSASGTAVYVETQNPITNANGLVSIEIGTGNLVSGTFNTIDWANDVYFIKTEIDITGGSTYTITGTSQLMSVPYAFHAKTAESISGGITESDPVFTASQANNITGADITKLSNLSGTNTGDQDISGIATNASDISTLQSEQTTQNNAIALNTAKNNYPVADANKLANIETNATADQTDAEIKTAYENNTNTNAFTDAEKTLLGNQSGANTGDQDISGIATNASDIDDLETEQTSQNAAIALNTAKETNATHTGDVTGATALTIADDAVTTAKLGTAGVSDANKALITDTNGDPQWSTIPNINEYGDIKSGIQNSDHNGWLLLDGRTLSSLTASQQTQAAALGLTGNLPDATNAYLSQNGSALGSVSGDNTRTIAQDQLPNVNYSGQILNVTHGNFIGATANGIVSQSNGTSSGNAMGGGTTESFDISIDLNGGVAQQSINIAPRTISVNTYIYLGN